MYNNKYITTHNKQSINRPRDCPTRPTGPRARARSPAKGHTPSPPTKSFDFRGFDSSRLFILRGGNSQVRSIV